MSSGAGHVLDMINRMKQNRSQLHSQKEKFKYKSFKKGEKTFESPVYTQVSPEELKVIKHAIKAKAKKENQSVRNFYIGVVLFGIILFILLYLLARGYFGEGL